MTPSAHSSCQTIAKPGKEVQRTFMSSENVKTLGGLSKENGEACTDYSMWLTPRPFSTCSNIRSI